NTVAATANFKGWYGRLDLSRVLEPGPEADALRRQIGIELIEATRAEWESMGVILGYRYEDSPICVPDGSPPTPDDYRQYVPTNRAGHRAPHAWIGENRSTLDLYGDGFVLVDLHPDAMVFEPLDKAARELGVPCRREQIP